MSRYISRGIPLMWSVELGFFKEDNISQKIAGHIRLIIGYNQRSYEILCSIPGSKNTP